MDKFTTINILDMNEVVGVDNMISILSDFSCPKNKEIEKYIQLLKMFQDKKEACFYCFRTLKMQIATIRKTPL